MNNSDLCHSDGDIVIVVAGSFVSVSVNSRLLLYKVG